MGFSDILTVCRNKAEGEMLIAAPCTAQRMIACFHTSYNPTLFSLNTLNKLLLLSLHLIYKAHNMQTHATLKHSQLNFATATATAMTAFTCATIAAIFLNIHCIITALSLKA